DGATQDPVAIGVILGEREIVFRIVHKRAQLRERRYRRQPQAVEAANVDAAVLVDDLGAEGALEAAEGVQRRSLDLRPPRLGGPCPRALWRADRGQIAAAEQRRHRIRVDGKDLPEPDPQIVCAARLWIGSPTCTLTADPPEYVGEDAGQLTAHL